MICHIRQLLNGWETELGFTAACFLFCLVAVGKTQTSCVSYLQIGRAVKQINCKAAAARVKNKSLCVKWFAVEKCGCNVLLTWKAGWRRKKKRPLHKHSEILVIKFSCTMICLQHTVHVWSFITLLMETITQWEWFRTTFFVRPIKWVFTSLCFCHLWALQWD